MEIFSVSGIKCSVNNNGECYFSVADVAKELNIIERRDAEHIYVRWSLVNKYLGGKFNRHDFISKSQVYNLINRASCIRAVIDFRSKFKNIILPEVNKYAVSTQYKIPKTFSEALRLAADLQEKLELTNNIAVVKPNEFKKYKSSTELSSEYGFGVCEFNSILANLKVQYKSSKVWHLYSKYSKNNYVINDGSRKRKWTPEGQTFIYYLLANNGIKPLSEKEVC